MKRMQNRKLIICLNAVSLFMALFVVAEYSKIVRLDVIFSIKYYSDIG